MRLAEASIIRIRVRLESSGHATTFNVVGGTEHDTSNAKARRDAARQHSARPDTRHIDIRLPSGRSHTT